MREEQAEPLDLVPAEPGGGDGDRYEGGDNSRHGEEFFAVVKARTRQL